MKKVLLLTTAIMASLGSFAQSRHAAHTAATILEQPISATAAKGAGNGDTILRRNYLSTDTITFYRIDDATPNDSGFYSGVNAYGDKGFAERFDIKGSDSSVSILGAALYLYGTASATSTKSIKVKAWSQGPKTGVVGRPKLFYNGTPNVVLDSLVVPLTQLRKSNGRIDSFRLFNFATPSAYISDSFFVGYDMAYQFNALTGDSVFLICTKQGNRHTPTYFVSGTDTIRNVQNAIQFSNDNWYDEYYQNSGLYHHFAVYALFKVRIPNGVNGVTRNDLTVFGTFPNPAGNNANLKISLTQNADVAVQIVDMAGRTVQTADLKGAATGSHLIPINTATLANGEYMCLVRTSNGDAMGVQMVVAH